MELALVAPLFIWLVLSMFEAGWLMTKSMMLERGLDITVRDMRLGQGSALLTHNRLKQSICDHSRIIRECEESIMLEVVAIRDHKDVPTNTRCRDRASTVIPKTSFAPGTDSQITFIRACVIVDPIMPGMGLGLHLPLDESGGLALVTYSAFVTEPA